MPSRPPLLPGTRILGIDPGLHVTGYAVIEVGTAGPVLCEAGVVRSTGEALPERLSAIHQGIVGLVEQYQPQVMVVEQLYSHYAHPRTAILMGHARGAILLAAGQHGIDTIHYDHHRAWPRVQGPGAADHPEGNGPCRTARSAGRGGCPGGSTVSLLCAVSESDRGLRHGVKHRTIPRKNRGAGHVACPSWFAIGPVASSPEAEGWEAWPPVV
jgi:crossover junction endodeoxyribonuclease RuvC